MADNSYNQDAEQTPAPNPDLKSLDRLVGTWRVSDPSGAGAIQGTVTFEWMEGGFFLIQHVDIVHGGHKIKGIEIIGHEQRFGEEPGEEIKSRYFDTMGSTFDYVYEVDDDTLTIWGGEKGSPAYYRGKWTDEGNTNTGGWVYPGSGGYESSMTRIK